MANALTLTAAAMPAAAGPLAGVVDNANVNGDNSAAWTFAGGAPGAADTIAAAQLAKGLVAGSRIKAFLTATYASQADLDDAAAALGLLITTNGGSLFRLLRAVGAAPTATMTTAAATGMISMRIAASVAQ